MRYEGLLGRIDRRLEGEARGIVSSEHDERETAGVAGDARRGQIPLKGINDIQTCIAYRAMLLGASLYLTYSHVLIPRLAQSGDTPMPSTISVPMPLICLKFSLLISGASALRRKLEGFFCIRALNLPSTTHAMLNHTRRQHDDERKQLLPPS